MMAGWLCRVGLYIYLSIYIICNKLQSLQVISSEGIVIRITKPCTEFISNLIDVVSFCKQIPSDCVHTWLFQHVGQHTIAHFERLPSLLNTGVCAASRQRLSLCHCSFRSKLPSFPPSYLPGTGATVPISSRRKHSETMSNISPPTTAATRIAADITARTLGFTYKIYMRELEKNYNTHKPLRCFHMAIFSWHLAK